MSSRFEPDLDKAYEILRDGLSGVALDSTRQELKLSEGASDLELARSLLGLAAASSLGELGKGTRAPDSEPPPDDEEANSTQSADRSLVGRIGKSGRDGVKLEEIDIASLTDIAVGGSLKQRRAALARIGEMLDELGRDELRQVTEMLDSVRDVELALDLESLRERLGGARGRSARADKENWRKSVQKLSGTVDVFWDGEHVGEPFLAMEGEARARILLRVRELPDALCAHLCAVLEGDDGTTSREDRRALLESLRFAADPRLLPTLVTLLDSGSSPIVVEAARSLRRLDDARALPALQRAYDRNAVHETRAVVASALGEHGDTRGLEYVRELLEHDSDATVAAALEALDTLGGREDTKVVVALLDRRGVKRAALHTLARIGDARALEELHRIAQTGRSGADVALAEDAIAAITARMRLRGEDAAEEGHTSSFAIEEHEERPRTSAGIRFRAFRRYIAGLFWLALSAKRRGIGRLEMAAELRPEWAQPRALIGLTYARQGRHAKAISAFRRALESDHIAVERNPVFARALATSFLKRAEEVERDGRRDVALGLLGEALDIDLRRTPAALRFELQRKRRELKRLVSGKSAARLSIGGTR